MMVTASPPGYSRLFATGLFLSTDVPTGAGSTSRSATPTPMSTTAPQTPFEPSYIGSTTLGVPGPSASRRPKLAALRTHSARTMPVTNPPSATTPTSASLPPSPRVMRRRRSSLTLSHNPITAIKSPTRSVHMSARTHSLVHSLGGKSPIKERRTCSLDSLGERSFEGAENTPKSRKRPIVARKPPPTTPLPKLPSDLPTLTLTTNFPSPNTLSPALTPSPNVLPAPTPGAIELGLHKFSFGNALKHPRPTRSPLVSNNTNTIEPSYFDIAIRMASPVLPENSMDTN
ncbi:unnamed protein product [Rhizoctonia solani]|uniref:Uncharacterized protein n=1 Tax=Rhizoctonia solani TaxID=456999 RepID=A0A8H3DBU6_9AGAM|nr:unnamed protein product [Rhizoctonia solani]